MTAPRSGPLPLLFTAGIFAIAVGVLVVLRAPDSGTIRAGGSAPAFELPLVSGERIDLEELRGRVVFVNFWATWCAPCREEAPSLQRLYADLEGEGFELLGVSIDAPDAAAEIESFRSEYALGFPLALDPDKAVYDSYGATGVPETFLIDTSGRLVERYVGPRDWSEPRYGRAIRRLLGPKSVDAQEGARGG